MQMTHSAVSAEPAQPPHLGPGHLRAAENPTLQGLCTCTHQLGVVAHPVTPVTQKAKAGGSQIQGQTGQHSKTLSPKKSNWQGYLSMTAVKAQLPKPDPARPRLSRQPEVYLQQQ